MNGIPPQCQGLADELAAAEEALLAAHEVMANAVGKNEKENAAQAAKAAYKRVTERRKELDKCRGCPDPITATYEDFASSLARIRDPRVPVSTPFITSAHSDTAARGLSFVVSGCDHESVQQRPGWRMLWSPFNFFTFTVPRRFPDIFGPTWVIDMTPYTITVSTIGTLAVEAGSHDRTTGHLDLWCAGTIGWTPIGEPARWLHGLYGLDFGQSSYRGLFTTRSVPNTIPPLGPSFAGSPRSSTGSITLVSSGVLVGGFGNGGAVEFTLAGRWVGGEPIGPP